MKININRIIDDKAYCEQALRFFIKKNLLRQEKLSSSKRHLNKAMDNLNFANFIFEEHKHSIKQKLAGKTFYDWVIIIYYYSIYHATLSLISKAGFESKNHLATLAAITLFYYHQQNIFKKEEIELLISKMPLEKRDISLVYDSKELRERASYGASNTFERSQALKMQEDAVYFVNKIRALLE